MKRHAKRAAKAFANKRVLRASHASFASVDKIAALRKRVGSLHGARAERTRQRANNGPSRWHYALRDA